MKNHDSDQKGKGWLPGCSDLAELAQGQEAILQILFDTSREGIFVLDIEGRVCKANQKFASMLGYTMEEIHESNVWDWDKVFSRDEVLSMLQQINGTGQYFETQHVRRDGSVIDVELSNSTAQFCGRKMIFCICRDISERKKVEEDLRENEAKFRSLFQKHPAVKLLIAPEDGSILDANEAAAAFYGWPQNELRNMYIQNINLLPPEQIKMEMEKVLSRDQVCFKFRHRTQNGLIRDVMVYSYGLELQGRTVIYSIVQDITKQRQLEEQLRHSQMMESIALLAGGVAHDSNNIMGVVLGYAEMALGKVEKSSPLHEPLTEILNAARRSANLTKQLLAFSRQGPCHPCALSLNEAVERMGNILRRLIGEDIKLCWQTAVDPWLVWMDPGQVDQILLNLCINARDSISGVGTILIETENVSLADAASTIFSTKWPGEYVVLTVRDDGCGMKEETRKRLFEPFYTTKEFGHGSGLGLSIVYGLVKQNDGMILVDSAPGQGSTFRIYLPRHSGTNKTSLDKSQATLCSMCRETVLVVEDDPFVRKLVGQMLKELEYAVLEAGTPAEALVLTEQHAEEIQILLTDVILPEMNGRDLATRLEQLCPNIRIVFMSGYTAGIISRKGVTTQGITLLHKPFSAAELSEALQEAMEK